ncbi:hypothetical protein L1987_29861 [Smallanthus sonchifolius]|uniref:Uncharacterized protein n=1 Tax=Smallanthus sonchifolius TaxID=185202 RepID=A0ACB9I3V6_9ASTR|nr:hypothetical protein L1987_29861 [Smallanthus sonchifolius]
MNGLANSPSGYFRLDINSDSLHSHHPGPILHTFLLSFTQVLKAISTRKFLFGYYQHTSSTNVLQKDLRY